MALDQILSRRLIFVSGKGGAGKTTVALALATAARARGARVLLVEIDAPVEAPDDGFDPALRLNLKPDEVMDEYVRTNVRIEALARRIIESPIYRRFFAAAPGLRELMVLGKIVLLEEAREGWSRQRRYDHVIVDAPATGHGLSLLKVPLAASRAIPVGPVGRRARWILEALRDHKRSTLVIVSNPEEMAVVEALDFEQSARDEVGIHVGAIVLNACHERRLSAKEEAEVLGLSAEGAEGSLARGVRLEHALAAARRQIRRRKLTRFYEGRLRRGTSAPLLSLPFVFEGRLGPECIGRFAGRLEAQ